jgi:hypothetical protein
LAGHKHRRLHYSKYIPRDGCKYLEGAVVARKLTSVQRKALNNRRRALRKLTGDHVDLRKPMTTREKRQLSRHRVVVEQLVQGLVKIAKPRSKKSSAQLKQQGLPRIKGGRFIARTLTATVPI